MSLTVEVYEGIIGEAALILFKSLRYGDTAYTEYKRIKRRENGYPINLNDKLRIPIGVGENYHGKVNEIAKTEEQVWKFN
mgnify:CR=1 FL=1